MGASFSHCFDLDASPGWKTFQKAGLSPRARQLFGSPRFTPKEQKAAPEEPRIRLVKDVLRVGKFKVGEQAGQPSLFDFSPEVLTRLADSFALGKNRGFEINLCNTHGDPQTKVVHPKDLIAPIDQVIFDKDTGTLWASCYVTSEQAKQLKHPSVKTSPRVYQDFSDGEGNKYDFALGHVAVVDQPVIPRQGPFFDMANTQGKAMDFAALVEILNELLPVDVTLPETVSEENLVDTLRVMIDTLKGAAGEAETAAEEAAETGSGDDTTPVGEPANTPAQTDPVMAEMANLKKQMLDMSNNFKSLMSDQTNQKAAAFKARLKALGSEGLDAKTIAQLEGLGAKHGWDMDLLSTYEGVKSVDLSNHSRQYANPTGYTKPKGGKRTDEEIAADLEAKGLKPLAPGYFKPA